MLPAAPSEPPFSRTAMLKRLAAETFDVLVIGGGVTGAGVALDAASRGLRTALVEAEDFASGTSSKSSKLVHGGLRYLKQGDVRLVYQALHERQRLRRNAPHLVKLLPFMVPILTKDGLLPRRVARALGWAMWLYDLTGGFRIGKLHKRISADEAFAHLPTMPRQRLASAYLYYDATADDARLVLTLLRTAAGHGAAVANRCRVVDLTKGDDGAVDGATVDTGDGSVTVRARVIVNAAGVWADEVRTFEDGVDPDSIRPANGVHITVPWAKVRNDIAVVVPVPGDKRSLFVVPWGPRADGTFGHTYIGTTDTDYEGRLDDPPCTAADIHYVLLAINATVTTDITDDDITGVWAGLRPLVKSATSGRTADLSRRHRVTTGPAGVIAVAGGKLTTYREMAEDTVDAALDRLDGGRRGKCRTKKLRLLGADGFADAPPGTRAAHLGDRYGTLAPHVEALVADDPSLGGPLVAGLPYLRAEAVYAVRHEMAATLGDVLTRRTRAHLFDRAATLDAASDVATLMAGELGWDEAEA
ncbi:MAG: glycerol-3-phosphate dehydrogenase/oxidase, partial [Acidimicrobiia bacterium]|nr:glycerol-3-phosphate dehydrogenase/oxidase [Acidimicrobiia bacterium]